MTLASWRLQTITPTFGVREQLKLSISTKNTHRLALLLSPKHSHKQQPLAIRQGTCHLGAHRRHYLFLKPCVLIAVQRVAAMHTDFCLKNTN